ncbi:hypothetical protein TcWFU_002557 [Taenia crassiceps]|uniref:Uncharacterized protein n=1 Tax=Taenia crassiceps TaxID=6207 RepID=A0ABR4PZ78_9CEST
MTPAASLQALHLSCDCIQLTGAANRFVHPAEGGGDLGVKPMFSQKNILTGLIETEMDFILVAGVCCTTV